MCIGGRIRCRTFCGLMISKVFCCYTITSLLMGIGVYFLVNKCLESLMKIENIEADITEFYKELSRLRGRSSVSDGLIAMSSCPEDLISSAIEKYTSSLQNDLIETKRIVNQLKSASAKSNDLTENTEDCDIRPDYASESLGGRIESVEDERFSESNFILSLFGIGSLSNEPRNILSPSMEPGNCYAFKGTKSTVTIKLMDEVYIDSISVAHIPANQSPTGNLNSAPKEFSVYGLKSLDDEEGFCFGEFVYNINLKKSVQHFTVKSPSKEAYRYVKFNFLTNYGHPNFTCVYRVSVHGSLKMNMLN